MKELILGAQSIFTGAGSLASLKNVPAARAFIVTGGSSMFKNGTIAKIEDLLKAQNCVTYVFSGVGKNPDTRIVTEGFERMREFAPDVVIGVGGGSPIDAAKVMALLYEFPAINWDNILTVPLPTRREKVKFIAIPSTSGTGSEVTKSAVVTFRDQEFKIGLRTPAFVPDVAILDPELTMTMPPELVAETGMDAMTHAVESYLNANADEFTTSMAVGAIEGIFTYLPLSYHDNSLAAREKMHYYQSLAGIAFANSGLGAVHGIAHALGGKFDLGHGLLNAIALPYVLEYNSQDVLVRDKLAKLARRVGKDDVRASIIELNRSINVPAGVKDTGVTEAQFREALPMLVANALKGPTAGNSVPIDATAMEPLLCRIFYGE